MQVKFEYCYIGNNFPLVCNFNDISKYKADVEHYVVSDFQLIGQYDISSQHKRGIYCC
jgi:hypothetical protein